MGLPNAAFVLHRHLWLQSLQRHFLATGLEVLIVVALAYVAVPKSAPTRAPLVSDVAVAEPIIGPARLAYPTRGAHKTHNVVYGPQNADTDALVKAAFGSANVTSVKQRSEVAGKCHDLWEIYTSGVVCIEFSEVFGRTKGVNLEYDLYHVTEAKVPEQLPLPTADSFRLQRKGSDKAVWDDTLDVQARLDYAYLEAQKKGAYAIPQVSLRPLPEVPPVEDVEEYRSFTPFLTLFVYCFPLLCRISTFTAELSTGLKDLQRINGLTLPEFWLGHFLSAFVIQMVESTAVMGFMLFLRAGDQGRTFFSRTDITLLVFVMAAFNTGHISTAMLVAAVCKTGTRAILGGVVWGFIIPASVMSQSSGALSRLLFQSRWSKLAQAMYPQLAGSTILRTLGVFDDYEGGANWGILSKRALDLDSVTPLELLAVMLVSCAVNVFLLFYLSNVLPWATDYPQQPLFCLMPGYWAPSRTLPIKDETEADEATTTTTRFEQAPLADTIVDIRGLTMVFGRNTALSKVNLKIYGSQVTVLLGPNGAGKTTLMTIIAGLLKPTSGSVNIYEGETDGAKTTGFCQQLDVLFSDLTVMEHLSYYAKLQGRSAVQLTKMIDETLDAVKLAEKKDCFPPQLSGGMKRRLSMAIALVGKPKLLILDEPTTGMDPETQRSIWELISSLRGTSTILLSTHDIEEAEVLADRIVMMNTGKIVCAGSPTFLKKSSGVGYKVQLSTKTVDFELGAIMAVVRETAPNALVKDVKQGSVTIGLQTLEHEGLAAMFRKLEQEAEQWGIENFVVTVATMRDAYITINELWVPEEPDDAQQDDTRSVQTWLQASAASCTGVITTPSASQRLRALFAKRHLYWTRSPFAIFLGWILTVAIFFLLCKRWKVPGAPSADLGLGVRLDLESSAHFDGARCFLQAERESDFTRHLEKLAELEGATVTRMGDAKQELVAFARRDFVKYYSHYAYGVVDNGSSVEGWYNPASPVACPVLLNLIDTAMLRAASQSASARITAGVSFYGQKKSARPVTTEAQKQRLEELIGQIGTNMLFWYSLAPSLVCMAVCPVVFFPIAEKLCGARELQLMTGISGHLYVASHFLFDLLFHYLVPFTACFAIYSFWYAELDFTTTVAVFVIVLAFAPVAIFEAYLLAHFLHSEAGAFTCALVVFVIGGPPVGLMYFTMEKSGRAWWQRPTFMLWPPFALGEAVLHAVNMEPAAQVCEFMHAPQQRSGKFFREDCGRLPSALRPCCLRLAENPSAELNIPGPFSLSVDGVLADVLYFVCQGVSLFILLSLLHSGYASRLNTMTTGGAGKPTEQEGVLDEDVRAEKDLAKRFAAPGAAAELDGEGYTLVVCDLHKTFGEVRAVRGISLVLRRAECFGLLGVNGAGKSTTFQMLTGLLEPSAGNAFMSDVNLEASPRKWQSFIGYCPQSNGLLEKLTAFEHLSLFAHLRGVPANRVLAAVQGAIVLMELEKQAFKPCELYSGGNKRRLSMALSVMGNPRVVLLDEPLAGIDVVARAKISANLSTIRAEAKMAVVFTSHGMEECEALCDRLSIMVAGQMTCLGSLQCLKNKFGTGYTMQLALPLKQAGGDGGTSEQETPTGRGQELDETVAQLFPGVRFLGAHDNFHDYHITERLPWSTMFEKVEELEQSFKFAQVLIQDTTLEQIFIDFAKKKHSPSDT